MGHLAKHWSEILEAISELFERMSEIFLCIFVEKNVMVFL
jgi:hypothetical protein